MILDKERSLCGLHQKIIVSKEHDKQHRADNTEHQYEVRHYHLDGDLVQQTKCCDYLLLNDSEKKAYFIELKGTRIDDAVPQLKSAIEIVQNEILGYKILLRIVSSNVRTHKLESTAIRNLKKKYSCELIYKTKLIEEPL